MSDQGAGDVTRHDLGTIERGTSPAERRLLKDKAREVQLHAGGKVGDTDVATDVLMYLQWQHPGMIDVEYIHVSSWCAIEVIESQVAPGQERRRAWRVQCDEVTDGLVALYDANVLGGQTW